MRPQLFLLYVPAAVAAGREAEVLPKLQAMEDPAGIFTAAARVLAHADKAEAAMAVVEALPPQAIVADTKAAGELAAVVQRIHQQHQQAARSRPPSLPGDCRRVRGGRQGGPGGQGRQHCGGGGAKQAAAFLALAAELQK